MNAIQLTLVCCGQLWVISLHFFKCVFRVCFFPYQLWTYPNITSSSWFFYSFSLYQELAFSRSKYYLPPCTIYSLVSSFSFFVGMTKGLLWLWCNWQLSESKLINKKMIMLQSTLHDSFKVLCEHYRINHHNSSGEDKHCWLSYLDHILKELFFVVIVWLCYKIWIAIFILVIWISFDMLM